MLTPLHRAALSFRTMLSRPLRQYQVKQMCLQGAAPIVVLFYHRVANTYPTPWSITHQDFSNHLDLITKTHEWIDLAEVQRRVREGNSTRPAVHVTFDDGYAENLEFAIPELMRRGIPCTYFVTLHHILTGESFDHDRKAGLPIKPNTIEELRELARAGVEIGAHTRHHSDMGRIREPQQIASEIGACARELSEQVQRPIRYFAFPYGMPDNISQESIAEVARSGMHGFCSAYGAYNLPGRDPFHIRRIHGDPELSRLENWLSFDHRKLRREPTVIYSLPPTLKIGY